jgi:hypothetical protein
VPRSGTATERKARILGLQPEVQVKRASWRKAGEWGKLPAGSTVTKGAVLFPRLEEKPTA